MLYDEINNEFNFMGKADSIELFKEIHINNNTSERLVKVRLTQRKFRNNLIGLYGKCQMCDIDIPEMLIASHIKPWNVSDELKN